MTQQANPYRGEASLCVGDLNLVLRPTFENLVAAESEIGSLFALVERASNGELTLAEVTALLWHCADHEPKPERDRIGEAVLECGLIAATQPVRTIIAQVLQGQT